MSTAGIQAAVAELLPSVCCTLPKSLLISSWRRGIRLQGSCLTILFMAASSYDLASVTNTPRSLPVRLRGKYGPPVLFQEALCGSALMLGGQKADTVDSCVQIVAQGDPLNCRSQKQIRSQSFRGWPAPLAAVLELATLPLAILRQRTRAAFRIGNAGPTGLRRR